MEPGGASEQHRTRPKRSIVAPEAKPPCALNLFSAPRSARRAPAPAPAAAAAALPARARPAAPAATRAAPRRQQQHAPPPAVAVAPPAPVRAVHFAADALPRSGRERAGSRRGERLVAAARRLAAAPQAPPPPLARRGDASGAGAARAAAAAAAADAAAAAASAPLGAPPLQLRAPRGAAAPCDAEELSPLRREIKARAPSRLHATRACMHPA
jgi:hypothetical protein